MTIDTLTAKIADLETQAAQLNDSIDAMNERFASLDELAGPVAAVRAVEREIEELHSALDDIESWA